MIPTVRTDMNNPKSAEPPSWLKRLKHWFLPFPKTAQELIQLLRLSEKKNVIETEAVNMMEGVLDVSSLQACEIMLPRSLIVTIPKEASLMEILKVVTESAHSRFPVLDDSEEVIGILLAKDLLNYQLDPNIRFSIKDVLRPAFFIPESKRLNVLLREFRRNRNHMALVVNEYGSVTGLATIEDVIEQIVGDIEDEHDIDEGDMIKPHTRQTYTVQALTPIGEFNEYFQSSLNDEAFDTIGGLVLQAFGQLPKRGESIVIDGIQFKVRRANTRRIKTLSVHLPQPLSPKES
jgi:magnesium and cobalt transporter